LLVFLLPVVVLIAVLLTVVNIPVADEWIWAPLVIKMHAGTLQLRDVWAQQATHRSFFPTLIALGLAKLFGWNTRLEAATSVVLAFLTQLVLFRLIAKTVPEEKRAGTFLLASILLFSLLAYENWTWGFQLSWYLVNLCVFVTITTLVIPSGAQRSRGTALIVAICAAIVASYSLLFGLGAWVAGAVLLRGRALIVWCVAAAATLALFLYGYHIPADDPGWRSAITQPATIVAFAIVYLGAPLALWAGVVPSAACGLALLAGWAYIIAKGRGPIAPWLALFAFVIVAALLEAIGRSSRGLTSALASHYTTTSSLAWIALAGAAASARISFARAAAAVGAASLVASCVGIGALVILHGYQQDARAALLAAAGRPGASLSGYPLWTQVRAADVDALATLREGPFRRGQLEDVASSAPPAAFGPADAAPWLYDTDPPRIVDVAVMPASLRSGEPAMMRVITTTNVADVTVALGPIAANLPRVAAGTFVGRAPIPRYPDLPFLFPRTVRLRIVAINSLGKQALAFAGVTLLR
jgi:hypothetical protein